ncbi:unnamed protein product [Thlaspi arvense]|uniref:GDSL esterase/lipase n=1 Tax=Thlaspi arvense TaxID=13288 RepID=A0AAU9SWD4_THLAR|nr:unnamed protein product [Thlaspi arvense]
MDGQNHRTSIELTGKEKGLKRGMNFAFGRSIVYGASPVVRSPNMSSQVNLLVDLFVARRVYTFDDISSSDVAVLTYSGQDYLEYIAKHDLRVYQAFVPLIVEDIKHCLLKLDGIIFKNIAVTSLLPIGCFPHFTSASKFQSCNESYSELVELHNKLLKVAVGRLNVEARLRKKGQSFFIIDIHKAFMTVLKKKGRRRFRNPLKPCCEGDCATVDSKGEKKYSLCDDPKSAFFWDKVNPTQEGWKSIYSVLGNPLTKG